MSTPSDPRTLVMHGLRVKGFAEASAVGEAVGVAEADAKPVLDQLVIDGQSIINDHSDGVYDAGVVEQLTGLHARVEPICDDLGATLDRYAGYGPRLSMALHKVRIGDGDWFTKPMIPSYHTVWFEMHEDLLSTLGIERGSEGGD